MSTSDGRDVAAGELASIVARLEVTHPHLDPVARDRKASRVLQLQRYARDPSRWTSAGDA